MTTICDSVQITYKGDGKNRIFTFPFEYIRQEDIDALLWDEIKKEYVLVDRDDWSFVNPTTVQYKYPPPAPTVSSNPADPEVFNVKISRSTDLSDMVARFYPGSAIRAEDLNDDFDQLRLAIQEGLCEIRGNLHGWIKTNFWSKLTDTITRDDQKEGKWKGYLKDNYIATTDAISQRLDPYVTDVLPQPLVFPAGEQEGKQWFDNESIVGRYWDEDAKAWVTLANTGPVGPTGPQGDPGLDVYIGSSPPADKRRAWYHTGRGRLLIWFDDGDSQQWVDASPSIAGAPGGPGIAGPVGAAGPQGPIGPAGPVGPQGIQGVKGDKGDVGPAGPKGANGVAGPTGPAGKDGKGVVIKGSVATAAALPTTGNTIGDMWISANDGHGHVWDGAKFTDVGQIQGPAGPTGPKGDKGDNGVDGIQGLNGPVGPQGPDGPQGVPGPTGPKGADGVSAGFNSASAVALASGDTPTVTLTGPDIARDIKFGIPAGPAGPKGDKGDPAVAATVAEIKAGTDSTKFVSASGLAGADLYLKNNESDSTTGRLTFNASTSNSWETAPTRGTVGQMLTSDGTGKTKWTTPTSGVTIATDAEATAGTLETKAVNPKQLKAVRDADNWTRTGTTLAPKTAGDVVTVSAGTAALPGLTPVGDPNTGIYSPGADQVALSTGGTSRVHVAADGKVGVGTVAPSAPLHALSSTGTAKIDSSTAGGSASLLFDAPTSSTARTRDGHRAMISSEGGPSWENSLAFYVGNNGGGAPTEKLRIATNGKVGIGVTAPTTAGGILQLAGGITFPATQVASTDPNTLDDYEEGTFTPVVVGTTTAGTATYTIQKARYTKIGRSVFIEVLLNWSAGTGTGQLFIDGLPFASASSLTAPSLALSLCSNITMVASHVLTARIVNNSTKIEFNSYPSGGGADATVAYDGVGAIGISGCYSV